MFNELKITGGGSIINQIWPNNTQQSTFPVLLFYGENFAMTVLFFSLPRFQGCTLGSSVTEQSCVEKKGVGGQTKRYRVSRRGRMKLQKETAAKVMSVRKAE